jgi:hypothetical protein
LGTVKRRGSRYECALCGETLSGLTPESKVQKVLVGASGRDNVRALMVDGKEIHRCRALGPRTSGSVTAV